MITRRELKVQHKKNGTSPGKKERKSKRRSNNQPTIGEDGEDKKTEPIQEIEEMIDKILFKILTTNMNCEELKVKHNE